MTKKCLSSFITYTMLSAICLAGMHLMSLVSVNKYVGVSIGGGILVLGFVLYMILRKNHALGGLILLWPVVSAIGCGLAISSLYVHLGAAPEIIYSFCIWGAYVILFLVYCLLTNLPLFKRRPRTCLAVYGILILAGGVIGICLSSKIIFSLVLMTFILFIAYLATILAHSRNYVEHNKLLALVSFIGLLVVVIVVLIVISEGEGLDALDFPTTGGGYKDPKKNPYDYTY